MAIVAFHSTVTWQDRLLVSGELVRLLKLYQVINFFGLDSVWTKSYLSELGG